MTDKTKSISEALAEVQRKVNEQRMKNAESNWNAINEAPKTNPNDPNNYGSFSTNNNSKYGFAAGGSSEDNPANFFASDRRMMDAQKAAPSVAPSTTPVAKPTTPVAKPSTVPLPPKRPTDLGARTSTPTLTPAQQQVASTATPATPNTAGMDAAAQTKGQQIASTDKQVADVSAAGGAQANPKVKSPAQIKAADTPRNIATVLATTAANFDNQNSTASTNTGPNTGRFSQADIDAEREKVAAERKSQQSQGSKGFSLMHPSTWFSGSNQNQKPDQLSPQDAIPAAGQDEDGGPTKSKGKKSMKEEMSPLVAAFLKLQESKPANMFEAAKKMKAVCPKCGKSPCVCESMEEEKELSPKQKKIAALGGDKKKLDAADFKALRSGKKPMEEEAEQIDEISKKLAVKSYLHSDPHDDAYTHPKSGQILGHIKRKFGAKTADKAELAADRDYWGPKKKIKEETEELFSEEELAHFASIIEGDAPSVAPARDDIANRSDKHDNNSDYGMDEEAKKRGVKAGTKRGPYKQKGLSSGEKDEAHAETKNVPAQVRTARSHFSGGKEVVTLKHPQTDKQYHVPVKHVNDFNKDYAAAERPQEKSAVERKFMQTHMSS